MSESSDLREIIEIEDCFGNIENIKKIFGDVLHENPDKSIEIHIRYSPENHICYYLKKGEIKEKEVNTFDSFYQRYFEISYNLCSKHKPKEVSNQIQDIIETTRSKNLASFDSAIYPYSVQKITYLE